jgi:branched-chain amino acid transport system ATP-binding protein
MRRILEATDVWAGYGDITVIRGLTLHLDEGEMVALLGPNGAGKTTFLRVITGLLRPRSGNVTFRGDRIDREPAYRVVRRGIAMMPEGKQLWPSMTASEHLAVAATGARLSDEERDEQVTLVYRLFPLLESRAHSRAVQFSGGEQQMLAIARALMSRPRLLLLDEPSLGLAPMVVSVVFRAIRDIRRQGVSVLLVEQNVRLALKLADRAYLMDQGTIYRHGTAAELASLSTADLASF